MLGAREIVEEADQKWIKSAKQRMDEIRSGHISAIPGDQVFSEIRERFGW